MSPQSQPYAEAHKIARGFPLHPTRQDVLEAFEGASFEAFRLLDETPGEFDPKYHETGWHQIMRRERNDPTSPILDQLRDAPGYVTQAGTILTDDADAPSGGDLEVTYPAHLEERQDDPSEVDAERFGHDEEGGEQGEREGDLA